METAECPHGLVEEATSLGGMNSRSHGTQLLIVHRPRLRRAERFLECESSSEPNAAPALRGFRGLSAFSGPCNTTT